MSNAKAVVRRWFDEVWNAGNEAAIDEMLAPGGIAHGLGEGEADARGPEEFKVFWRNMRSALPDVQIHVLDLFEEEGHVTARVVLEGTHSGDGFGSKPTGHKVRIAGIAIVRVVDGQFVEGWNSWDQLGLLRQLGLLAHPSAQDRFLSAEQ